MKKSQTRYLPILFIVIGFLSTAFIIHSKNESASQATVNNVAAPPQYKTSKTTFFKRL
jgi:hypothetical protein